MGGWVGGLPYLGLDFLLGEDAEPPAFSLDVAEEEEEEGEEESGAQEEEDAVCFFEGERWVGGWVGWRRKTGLLF